jgi:hypothetical protein
LSTLFSLSLTACGGDEASPATNVVTDPLCPVVVKDADCDKSQRPMVFVHGTMGSGDNFANVAALLASNGYCPERLVAIDYDSIGGENPAANGKLDAAVDKVLASSGMDKIELIGHSLGTRYSVEYLNAPSHAAKVAHYINLSGSVAIPNGVPTLSISSKKDLLLQVHHATGTTGTQVKTVTFDDEDHVTLAFSAKAFIEIYKYLRNESPRYTDIQCGDENVTIEGYAVSLADNTRIAGSAELYEIGDQPRQHAAPINSNSGDADGHFGPIQLKRNVAYELKGYDEHHNLVGYQYFSPFKRSNHLVRLIIPSRNPEFALGTTDKFKRTRGQVDVVLRTITGAFRQDLGDHLTVDGTNVLSTDIASLGPGAFPTVALLAYDANENNRTDLGKTFDSTFILGTDVFIDATTPKFVELDFNGKKIKISNWPASDALISVLFL